MNDYVEAKIRLTSVSHKETDVSLSVEDAQDILSARLADSGYESFEKDGGILTAFVPAKSFDRQVLDKTLASLPFADSINISVEGIKHIEGEDWNSVWEKNYFQPYIFGENKCVIHSSFHYGYPECDLDIVIDPKMAFGTGHHSTTRLMVEALLNTDLKSKPVLDVGTGSGILAIISEKLGAENITAVEIDESAYVNALENSELNGCRNINFILGDIDSVNAMDKFDILLANINRNVILEDLPKYCSRLKPDAQIFLSGFYEEDAGMILDKASTTKLRKNYYASDNRWAIIGLVNN